MSNARNLANLLGTATTVQTAKIADDAITNAKLNDSGSFTVAGLTVSGTSTFQGATTATSTTAGFGAFDKILLNGTDGSSTDAGDSLLLNQTAAAGTDDGDEILYETATSDPNELLNSTNTGFAGGINFTGSFKSPGNHIKLITTPITAVTGIAFGSEYINKDFEQYMIRIENLLVGTANDDVALYSSSSNGSALSTMEGGFIRNRVNGNDSGFTYNENFLPIAMDNDEAVGQNHIYATIRMYGAGGHGHTQFHSEAMTQNNGTSSVFYVYYGHAAADDTTPQNYVIIKSVQGNALTNTSGDGGQITLYGIET